MSIFHSYMFIFLGFQGNLFIAENEKMRNDETRSQRLASSVMFYVDPQLRYSRVHPLSVRL